jgi:hypothetical protein
MQQSPTAVDPRSLHLFDLELSTDKEMAPAWMSVSSYDLNDRFALFVGYSGELQSEGRDVFWFDLETGDSHHMDHTYVGYQVWALLWDDWTTIRGRYSADVGPSYLELYSISTGESTIIVDGDYAVTAGFINAGIVAYNTSAYTGSSNLNPSDIEVYSIRTGTARRLTTSEVNLRIWEIGLPHLVLIDQLNLPGPRQNDFYVANLEALGVLDASGALLPGDPVIDPP